MRTILQVLISAVVLMLSVASLPATAATTSTGSFQTAVMNTDAVDGHLQTVALRSTDIEHLSLGQAAAIVGGAIAGGSVVDILLDGTVFTIIGVIIGATLGNEWYERGMWPF
ncbi:conserved exported hypothetical protein [Gammaproteobacteria bacterium]